MKKYQSYKSSGVEWIGDVPIDWDIIKIRRLGKLKSGNGFSENLQGREIGGDYPFYKVSDTNNPGNEIYLTHCNNYVTNEEFKENKWYLFETNSIIFPKIGMVLLMNKRRILKQPSFIDNNMMGFTPNSKILSKFSFYLFKQIDFKIYSSDGTVPSIGEGQISSIKVVLPPLQEQEQIVKYLDEKTTIIDKLISTKQRKVELLKEQRTTLINQVITKGLNTKVKMKDSGVEWIGEIPESWSIKKMKYCLKMISEKKEVSKEDIKISPENVENGTGVCFNFYSDYTGEGMKFIGGDILLNKLRIYLKKILITENDGFSMGEMIVLRTIDGINKYYYYTLFNQGLIDLLNNQSTGVKLPRVSPDTILNSEIVYPPIEEQKKIVEYLDKQTKEIDDLVFMERNKIELLKEYRQSLISEVITGKIKVVE